MKLLGFSLTLLIAAQSAAAHSGAHMHPHGIGESLGWLVVTVPLAAAIYLGMRR
jgi:hypothetical protein